MIHSTDETWQSKKVAQYKTRLAKVVPTHPFHPLQKKKRRRERRLLRHCALGCVRFALALEEGLGLLYGDMYTMARGESRYIAGACAKDVVVEVGRYGST